MGVCCLWYCSLHIIYFLWQQIKVNTVKTKQKAPTSPVQSYPVSLSRATTQSPGKPLRARCAQLALGDNQWCQDPFRQTVLSMRLGQRCLLWHPWSGLNSAINTLVTLSKSQCLCTSEFFLLSVHVSDFGVESAWHSEADQHGAFPEKESPHLLLKILLKAFERQGLKCILLAAWAPPLSIFTRRYKELKVQCDGMRSSGHRRKAGWRKPCVDGGLL